MVSILLTGTGAVSKEHDGEGTERGQARTVWEVGSGASLRDEPRTPDPGNVRGCPQGRGAVVEQDGSAGIPWRGERYSPAPFDCGSV